MYEIIMLTCKFLDILCGLLGKVREKFVCSHRHLANARKNYAHMRTTCVAQFHRIVYRIHFALKTSGVMNILQKWDN